MTNGYEYIEVDPRVIKMFGGDPDSDTSGLNESFDGDLSSGDTDLGAGKFAFDSPVQLLDKTPAVTSNFSDELLRQILIELREIKTILAGR